MQICESLLFKKSEITQCGMEPNPDAGLLIFKGMQIKIKIKMMFCQVFITANTICFCDAVHL